MEGQSAGVDAEERIPAQHFHIPVFKVESAMRNHGGRVDGEFVIGSVRDREVDGRLAIGSICDRRVNGRLAIKGIRDGEVGQSCNTGSRGLGGG